MLCKDFGDTKLEWLRQFLPYESGIPVDDTIARVMRRLDTKEFQSHFISWMQSVSESTNDDVVAIKPNEGRGGIGGGAIKPIGLANVQQFYKLLGNKIDIIGCGGIIDGQDAFEYILCGATAIQIGTQYIKEGERCFKRVSWELEKIMMSKGCTKISDFKGRLRYL